MVPAPHPLVRLASELNGVEVAVENEVISLVPAHRPTRNRRMPFIDTDQLKISIA